MIPGRSAKVALKCENGIRLRTMQIADNFLEVDEAHVTSFGPGQRLGLSWMSDVLLAQIPWLWYSQL